MPTRRDFITTGLGLTLQTGLMRCPAAADDRPQSTKGVLFEGYAIPPRKGVQEATLATLKDGRIWLLFGENLLLAGKYSKDGGRTWSGTSLVQTKDGKGIALARDTAHLSIVRLKSGRLVMIYGGPVTRPGRDGTVLYRTSDDEGQTWSAPVAIDPLFAVCRTQAARVLSTGRIVAPVMAWLSPATGDDSEEAGNGLTYSWIYYSDDEGKTWKRSLSELFVSLDQGRKGTYHVEETVIEEMRDGRLLLYGRTEFGRPYQSISKDKGVSWSNPTPLQLASAYSPSTLSRIPATNDLLLVWNHVSTEEILAGLARHRLSTAISRDEGATWTHFRNLESLDDRTRIEPPPAEPKVYRMTNYGYRPPVDPRRYPHSPGCLRICYATVAFRDREIAIAYDYGFGGPGSLKEGSATKIKVVSLDWLYGRV